MGDFKCVKTILEEYYSKNEKLDALRLIIWNSEYKKFLNNDEYNTTKSIGGKRNVILNSFINHYGTLYSIIEQDLGIRLANKHKCLNVSEPKKTIIGKAHPLKMTEVKFIEDENCTYKRNKEGKITYLSIVGKDISVSINFIKKLTELKELYLIKCELTNLSFLKELKHLTVLSVRNNNIKNITDEELSSLYSLDIGRNNIETITIDSQNLRYLACDNNNISHAQLNTANLISLDISENKLIDINFIIQLKKLQYLHLQKNKIENIDPLNKLESLKLIDIRENDKINIQGLNNSIKKKAFIDISYTMPNKNINIKELKELVGNNKVKEAIKILQKKFPEENKFILLQSFYENNECENNYQTINNEHYQITRNKINKTLLDFITEIEEQERKTSEERLRKKAEEERLKQKAEEERLKQEADAERLRKEAYAERLRKEAEEERLKQEAREKAERDAGKEIKAKKGKENIETEKQINLSYYRTEGNDFKNHLNKIVSILEGYNIIKFEKTGRKTVKEFINNNNITIFIVNQNFASSLSSMEELLICIKKEIQILLIISDDVDFLSEQKKEDFINKWNIEKQGWEDQKNKAVDPTRRREIKSKISLCIQIADFLKDIYKSNNILYPCDYANNYNIIKEKI